jgi:ABC-2 type transport system permease protein
VAALPAIVQPISYILPVTYGVDVLHNAITGTKWLPVSLSLLLLIIFSFLLFYISLYNIRKKWIN